MNPAVGLIVFFTLISEAKSYTFLNWDDTHYASGPIQISYLSGSCQSIGITDEDMLFYIQQVNENYWGKVKDTSLILGSGQVIRDPFFQNGVMVPDLMSWNTIQIACAQSFDEFQKSADGMVTGGLGKPFCQREKGCRGAVILNGNPEQVSKVGRSYSRQWIGILAHEIGHALGLGHSLHPGALMSAGSAGFFSFYELKKDDQRAIQALFPIVPRPKMREVLQSMTQISNAEVHFSELGSGALMSSGLRQTGSKQLGSVESRCEKWTNAVLNDEAFLEFFGEIPFHENYQTIGMFFFNFCKKIAAISEVKMVDEKWFRDQILVNLRLEE